MDKSLQELNDKFTLLQNQYRADLPLKLSKLQSIYSAILNDNHTVIIDPLESELHKLAGSAGVYGFAQLSDLAKNAKIVCSDIKSGKNSQKSFARLNEIMTEITRNNVDVCSSFVFEANAIDTSRNSIDVYTKDKAIESLLKKHFEQCDYNYQYFNRVEDLIAKTAKNSADILIIDSDGLDFLKRIEKEDVLTEADCTKIILSPTGTFVSRLSAVRAGSDVFMTKPLDINVLNSKITEKLYTQVTHPYEVLIINDQQEQIDYYTLILEQADFVVSSTTSPETILTHLEKSRLDCILLDINMPICDGLELAKLIRQHHTNFDIPIIFLSANEVAGTRSQVRTSGGDDYLAKPISSESLIEALKGRAKRYRSIKKIMNSDSLTGLLNHSTSKQILATEILRAKRYKRPLSVALIDIDYFKQINDNFGHQVGDMVIKNLSMLLRVQLRRTDFIGRYGGEEFIVIMPETDITNAKVAIEKIRQLFGDQKTQDKNTTVQSTLSAGLASLVHSDEAESLLASADKALYQAKASGRNCTINS